MTDDELFENARKTDQRPRPQQSDGRIALAAAERALGRRPTLPDSTCWFHLTRVPRDTDFSEGLLPLQNVVDRVWSHLESALKSGTTRKRVQAIRSGAGQEGQYARKIRSAVERGPFAFLVRDTAFSEMGLSYLNIPEILDEICIDYEKRHGVSIEAQATAELVPCIVKFWSSTGPEGPRCLEEALRYIRRDYHGEEQHLEQTFDGQGRSVPTSRILGLDYEIPELASAVARVDAERLRRQNAAASILVKTPAPLPSTASIEHWPDVGDDLVESTS